MHNFPNNKRLSYKGSLLLLFSQNNETLKSERKYYLRFSPGISTDFHYNGGRPCLRGDIGIEYYYTDQIYKDTPSGKMIIYSNSTMVNSATLTDGLVYDPVHSSDPATEAMRKGHDYIREHANHFLEEAYEKIPEARNADEILY